MLKQFAMARTTPVSNLTKRSSNLCFRLVLAAITGTALGFVVLPILEPLLNTTAAGLSPLAYSHISRSSALVAYTLIWVSMLAGLSITSKASRKFPGVSASFGLHRYTTLLGLGFAAMHVLTLLSDKYMNFSIGQLLTPFMAGSYKPQWLGLGQIALYSFVVIAFSFYARNRIGVRTWRLIHSLSFALFLMTLMHGMQSSADSSIWWVQGLYWVSAVTVLLGSLYRVLAARAGRSKATVAATGLVAAGGRSQTRPTPRVLQPQQ